MKNKYFIINLVIFPFDILIIWEKDYDLFKKILCNLLKRNIDSELDKDKFTVKTEAISTILTTGQSFIKFNEITHDSISHEINHVVQFILGRIGIKLNKHTSEVYGYLTGFITKEIYKEFKNRKIIIK